jgi:hypothetical protein
MKKILTLGVFCIILCACSSSESLVKSLSKYSFSPDYPYEGNVVECERKVKIAIGAIRADSLDMLTKINKTETKIYPFIIFNSFTENFRVNLGQNSLEKSFTAFFTDSFLEESKWTGCYTIVDDPKNADYVVDFILKNRKTESIYQMKNQILFLLWFYMANYQESASSAFTGMEVQVRLIGRAGRSEKIYTLEREMPWHGSRYEKTDDLRYHFMENMVKSLSMTTRECIEMIIKDINLTVRYKSEE